MTLIYSFTNINDVSWGNRPKIEGATSQAAKELAKKEGEIKKQYARFRNKIVAIWLFCSLSHISLFMYYLDHEDPILGGVMRYTVYLLMVMMLLSMIATFMDILWYYPVANCVWAKQRAPPVPEVMVSVKQFVNSNLLGGDITRKEYADMDEEVSEVASDSDIQDE